MSQEAFDFGRLHTADASYRRSMRAMADAVDKLSPIVVQGATKIDTSDMNKMLAPGSARHFRFQSAFVIGALADLEERRRIVLPFNQALGFGEPTAAKPMTAEERRVREREWLAKKAVGLLEQMDKELGQ